MKPFKVTGFNFQKKNLGIHFFVVVVPQQCQFAFLDNVYHKECYAFVL